MVKKSIFKKDTTYSFSDYFNLNNPTKDILEEFGYSYVFEELTLPQTKRTIGPLEKLRATYIHKLPFISLNSEIAKREFYISPLLLELLDYVHAQIDVEYPLDAGENLFGTVDYLLQYTGSIVIIEAKRGDLDKGFNQLAVELIAMDKSLEGLPTTLYGAVTLGDIWRFGTLERQTKVVKKDMHAYVIPSDLDRLFAVLLGMLENEQV